MAEEAVMIEWDSNHARSQDRSVDSQNERAHMSILTSVVRVIQSLPPLAPFKQWHIEIVLALDPYRLIWVCCVYDTVVCNSFKRAVKHNEQSTVCECKWVEDRVNSTYQGSPIGGGGEA